MAYDVVLKQDDTGPSVAATLTDGAGVAVALTGATVRFRMRPAIGGAAVVDAPAVVVDPVAGTVRYDWSAPDTAVAGAFEADFRVAFGSGVVQSFPNSENIHVLITARLA